jgi:hypothetical protein
MLGAMTQPHVDVITQMHHDIMQLHNYGLLRSCTMARGGQLSGHDVAERAFMRQRENAVARE